MQLSAANLLIASQQLARGSTKTSQDAQAQFASALAKEKGVKPSDFEPMNFRQAAPAVNAASPAPVQERPAGYNPSSPIGAKLDIRV